MKRNGGREGEMEGGERERERERGEREIEVSSPCTVGIILSCDNHLIQHYFLALSTVSKVLLVNFIVSSEPFFHL